MPSFEKRYYIMVGNYGSGKTELSLNLALRLRKERKGRVALVDLDIVNPYFRSAEKREMLVAQGIEVLMPSFAMTTVDIPALPAEMASVFEGDFDAVIIDVGGDDTGAVALGMYAPLIAPRRDSMCVCYVVNPFRPLSATKQDVEEMAELIKSRARLSPDCLVNNANLQDETTAMDLIDAQGMLMMLSQDLGIPVGLICGEERLKSQLPKAMQELFFPIVPMMRPEWLEDKP